MGLIRVTATDFQQNVGRYQDAAQREPVEITKNGRPHTVMLSAALFEVLTKGRVARKIEELDDETAAAISRAEVSSEHKHLDGLLEDWKP